ncbi:hypothetical protein [Vibrio parahaemolyticus]|uniref:hypothetical protein n=1 Tax=Vibrio parahaemolyticus TaxID=670 RepID=UPI001B83943E|nr:hypothetical protein [Vibrio parahaemolyticus]EJG1899416.1 hypothetical protein [Vibrio parahaemolyticus]MDS1787222.1 hypothetical protein [Vibrio parahaemolyticus]HBC3841163.1 hypothetical protein [Vibrio parahaemolyticus]
MFKKIQEWFTGTDREKSSQPSTSVPMNQANQLILRSMTLAELNEARIQIQNIIDCENLTLDQMMRIGDLYEKQIGRIMLLNGQVQGLNITFTETNEDGVLKVKDNQ